mmetsp:Transcript_36780/g.79536  ORF Transcript_36780/g.79536 Transcript_36780/m.79536 type:complete len:282 (-) Transcript_36780:108-953(-)
MPHCQRQSQQRRLGLGGGGPGGDGDECGDDVLATGEHGRDVGDELSSHLVLGLPRLVAESEAEVAEELDLGCDGDAAGSGVDGGTDAGTTTATNEDAQDMARLDEVGLAGTGVLGGRGDVAAEGGGVLLGEGHLVAPVGEARCHGDGTILHRCRLGRRSVGGMHSDTLVLEHAGDLLGDVCEGTGGSGGAGGVGHGVDALVEVGEVQLLTNSRLDCGQQLGGILEVHVHPTRELCHASVKGDATGAMKATSDAERADTGPSQGVGCSDRVAPIHLALWHRI